MTPTMKWLRHAVASKSTIFWMALSAAVVGDFESAVWAILRIRTAVEAAVGKWSAQPLVEEQK
jgi:hypothetical protein